MNCEICGSHIEVAQKFELDGEIFILCNDCMWPADDIKIANSLGDQLKSIIDSITKKKKDDLQ